MHHSMRMRGGVTVSKKLQCQKCGRCCCNVLLTVKMFNRFKHLAVKEYKIIPIPKHDYVLPETSDGRCIFLNDENVCVIYKDRPKVCRIYGINKELPCIRKTDAERRD